MENFKDKYPSSNKINTLHTYDTNYSSDSVEWCPHYPRVLVCANYQLVENETMGKGEKQNERLGRILLFSVMTEGLHLHQSIESAAVLDQKWCHNQINEHSILGVVTAKKTIEIYKLNVGQNFGTELSLIAHLTITDDDRENLILSLDWSTGKSASAAPEIICSDSRGNIHRLKFENDDLVLINSWHAHTYESWISAFYYWDTNIVLTGGDDSLLLQFDNRIQTDPIVINKTHKAGVTAIHSNAKKEFIVATGSYDSFLRLWDIRQMKSPKNELKLPGTVWRLKWDPIDFDFLLSACMLAGAHIIKADNVDNIQIAESYYEHKNIVYGADWSFLDDADVKEFRFDGNRIIGTCSFYDHLLCISKLYCCTEEVQ